MKWHLITFNLLFLFFLIGGERMLGQDLTPPEIPVLTYVTVDTSDNSTKIFWKKSPSRDVTGYILYYEVFEGECWQGRSIDTVSALVNSYTHENSGMAGKQSVLYSVTAIDTAGNESLRKPGLCSKTGLHSTLNLTAIYDSCQSTITLNWNKYEGWDNYLSGYKLHAKWADTDTIIGLGKDSITKVFYRIPENTLFYSFIEGLQNTDALISMSNIATKFTYMPPPPDELLLDYVTVTGPNTVDLQFSFTEPTEITSFALLKSNKDSAQSVPDTAYHEIFSSPVIVGDFILTSSDSIYYRIGALNTCGIVIGKSNLASNILLSGFHIPEDQNNKEGLNELNWNSYNRFPGGTDYYEIYRLDNEGLPVLLDILDDNDTRYFDDLSDIAGKNYSGQITYQVKAVEKGTSNFAFSNFHAIKVTSEIVKIPNAFTPNGDSKNDVFKPQLSFIPDSYLMNIFDRNGFVVFESRNSGIGWDGKINGNKYAPEGVYIYNVQFLSFNGIKVEKTGHVTLLFPNQVVPE
jgi:gliding motility-associated-like protein